jgi:beta-lactam-binding protein with PASTA domain
MDLDSIETYVASHLKLFIVMALGLLVFVGIVALTIFFFALRGGEQTMVPDVRGRVLTEALLELQVKELYPKIQLRYSQTSQDKGLILEQDPRPGAIVKAGRRIRLVVSQGVMISKIENYVGRNIDEVRTDLQTLSSGIAQPLLSMKEPLLYEYSREAQGSILRQNPEPGTDITGPIQLEFVLSQGMENPMITVPQLTGLSITDALKRIGDTGINFSFSLRAAENQEKGETVVFQEPEADSLVRSDTVVEITVTPPERLAEGEVFKLFRYTIPKNPYPLSVRLEALLPTGERRLIVGVEYSGGEFIVPCKVPAGSSLILSMLNREIYRETVRAQTEPLSLDQL